MSDGEAKPAYGPLDEDKEIPSEARQLCYDIQHIYFMDGSVDDIMDLVRKRMQELEMKEWNL